MSLLRTVFAAAAVAAGLWAAQARANGGGYTYGVEFTGSIAPFQPSGTEHVRIEEEQLEIVLRRTYAAVTVRYTMRNVTAAPAKVRFGFPVEATQLLDLEGGDRATDLRRAIQQLRGYDVTAGGAPVAARFEVEPFAAGKVKRFPGSKALAGIAGWMISEVTFPAGVPTALEIRYAADYTGSEGGTSDDTRVSPGRFLYRLSTGAVWNGKIEKGTVTVRADGIAAEEVKVTRGGLARDGDGWVRSLAGLEPTLADDLEIEAVPGYFSRYLPEESRPPSGYQAWLQLGGVPGEKGGRWGGKHQRFRATASSTLAPAKRHDFGPQRLAAEFSQVPWAEGAAGNGTGEWVELTLDDPHPLLALSIHPGYPDGKLYAQNARPSRVEILLNGEHRIVSTLGEVSWLPGERAESNGWAPRPEQLVPIRGYDQPVKTVRITILEVFPGTKYEDACIAKVALFDLLPARPELGPSR